MRIAIMAGEASGDQLGADVMRNLNAEFEGIGGGLMQHEGLASLFPMEELSLMGVVEVLPRAGHLLKRVREAADMVIDGDFDALITIDSPDFAHRVAKRIKAVRSDFPIIHYVAPSVWAWRAGRAKKMARYVDHVLCLLPFEPPLMEAAGMSADFVGHPVARQKPPKGLALWKKNNPQVLGLFAGSRKSEISNHINIYKEFIQGFEGKIPVVLPTMDHLFDQVSEKLQHIDNIKIISPSHSEEPFEEEKAKVIYGADMAVATSGTVSFELSFANTNAIIGYQTNALNRFLAKRLITLDYASLTNILLDEPVIPELLFENFTAHKLRQTYDDLAYSQPARAKQCAGYARMRKMMTADMDAAQSVERFLAAR